MDLTRPERFTEPVITKITPTDDERLQEAVERFEREAKPGIPVTRSAVIRGLIIEGLDALDASWGIVRE